MLFSELFQEIVRVHDEVVVLRDIPPSRITVSVACPAPTGEMREWVLWSDLSEMLPLRAPGSAWRASKQSSVFSMSSAELRHIVSLEMRDPAAPTPSTNPAGSVWGVPAWGGGPPSSVLPPWVSTTRRVANFEVLHDWAITALNHAESHHGGCSCAICGPGEAERNARRAASTSPYVGDGDSGAWLSFGGQWNLDDRGAFFHPESRELSDKFHPQGGGHEWAMVSDIEVVVGEAEATITLLVVPHPRAIAPEMYACPSLKQRRPPSAPRVPDLPDFSRAADPGEFVEWAERTGPKLSAVAGLMARSAAEYAPWSISAAKYAPQFAPPGGS